ncbi:proline-rich transmembrane protein 1-like isoform X2 [Saccostrea echinata]|uniref:proline-rich transmembrane protein 1-like isoform X2 n=1 Tax=Saccostrea echinata TaxID=191078 RepID=UPI002A80EB9A|nr:proline-rich transmembrane protein 1-like isoform X2 [Saccostrea echinata]
MSSRQKFQGDSYNAGYDQLPTYEQQQPSAYGYPMTRSSTNVIVTNAPAPHVVAARRGNDWLVPAVLSCLCCFWPTGICAIVAASNARSRFDEGDYEGGQSSANSAKRLTLISLGLGILSLAAYIILKFVVLKETESQINEYTTTTTLWNWNPN